MGHHAYKIGLLGGVTNFGLLLFNLGFSASDALAAPDANVFSDFGQVRNAPADMKCGVRAETYIRCDAHMTARPCRHVPVLRRTHDCPAAQTMILVWGIAFILAGMSDADRGHAFTHLVGFLNREDLLCVLMGAMDGEP